MRTWWIILILSFVLFSFAPSFYELERSSDLPPDRTFELVHNYITDYHFYLSRIREGWDGRWTVIERYTNEPHPGSFIQEFYLLLGKAGRFIPEPTMAVTYVYHSARFVASILLLSFTVWAATFLFSVPLWSVLAVLLAVCASGWPIIVPIGNSWRFGGYLSWFTVMDIHQRISFLPHIVIGQAMVLFLIIAGNDRETLKKKGNWIFLGILMFLLGMIFPPGLVFVGVGLGIGMVIDTVWDRKFDWRTKILPRVVIGVISLPSLIYYSVMLAQYPWKRLMDFGVLHPVSVSLLEYIKALGPVLPLGLAGVVVALWRKDRKFTGAISWVIAWIILFWIFLYIPQQSSLRFAEMAPHIPLAFFTIYLSKTIVDAVKKRKGMLYAGIVAFTVPILCIVMGLGIMYSFWEWGRDFVNQKVSAGWPVISMNNYIVYPTNGFIEAITYINNSTDPESVIGSDLTAGNYIPARTGRRVYVGHDGSVRKEEKVMLVEQFFRGNMGKKDAYAWLKREGITHIFYGPQEKGVGSNLDIAGFYPFLRQVFTNSDVTLFEIQ